MFHIRANRRKLAGAIAGVTALAGLALWIYVQRKPTIRPELVGTWQGELYPETVQTLHSNGAFESRSLEANIHGHRNIEFRSKGHWSATSDSITYWVEEQQAFQDGKPYPKVFDSFETNPIPRKQVVPIYWKGKDRYTTNVKMGGFVRISTPNPSPDFSPVNAVSTP